MNERTLASIIEGLPANLAVWHDGPAALPRLMAMVVLERLKDSDRLRASIRAAEGERLNQRLQTDHVDRWRHAASALVKWSADYGMLSETPIPPYVQPATPRNKSAARRARRRPTRPEQVTMRDYSDAVRLASNWWELNPISVGLRAGDMVVESTQGRHSRLSNKRRPEIEVLDLRLAQVTALRPRVTRTDRLVPPAPGFGVDPVDKLTRMATGVCSASCGPAADR